MLSADDDLDPAPRRVLIAGTAGAGKTTLARRIGFALGVPHTEIDSLYHGPNWTPRATFDEDVAAYTAEPAWVTEWQYHQVRQLLLDRADTLVWLDQPLPVAFVRLLRRTFTRRLRKLELWNGNVEQSLWRFFVDPDHIIRWGIRSARESRRRIPEVEASNPHLRIVRLGSQGEVDRFVRLLTERRP
jgi:adenylate kinase family enzyme